MKSTKQFEMNKFDRKELEGKKFGKLTVIDFNPEKSQKLKASVWNCKCDCGNITTVDRPSLINGKRTDCGRCLDSLVKPGVRFGKLTIIEQDPEMSKSRNKAIMHCKCDCGNDCYYSRSDILSGKKTQCKMCTGSSKRDTEDISGQKFGKLTAIRYDPERSASLKKTVWECRCDCGNVTYTTISNLKGGIAKSCGCQRKEWVRDNYKVDMIGKRFGKLVVKSENIEAGKKVFKDGNIVSTIPYYDCLCDCGTMVTVAGNALRSGNTKSCGYCYTGEDLTGKVFGRLTVIERSGYKFSGGENLATWKCKCVCGNYIDVTTAALKSGNTKSCGCLIKDGLKARGKYGLHYQTLKAKYNGIYDRCYNPSSPHYSNYGGRGIKMADRWLGENGLHNFYADMVDGYMEGLTLDRIDVNGPYSPENCKWSTVEEQNYNKRNNVYVDYYGKKICLAELVKHFAKTDGLNSSIISHRIKAGYTIDEALSKPLYSSSNKDNYFKEHPVIKKPFMFKEELDKMGLYAKDMDYSKDPFDPNSNILNINFDNLK